MGRKASEWKWSYSDKTGSVFEHGGRRVFLICFIIATFDVSVFQGRKDLDRIASQLRQNARNTEL